jgi:hypothetical protein
MTDQNGFVKFLVPNVPDNLIPDGLQDGLFDWRYASVTR